MELKLIHWQEYGETVMHPFAIAVTVLMGLLVLIAPRRYAPIPIIVAALLVTELQRVVIAGLDFNVMRIMAVVGWIRLIIRREYRGFTSAPTDKLVMVMTASAVFFFTLQVGTTAAFINRLGHAVNGAGLYYVFRLLIRDGEDLRRTVRALLWMSLPIAGTMVLEQLTGRNIFALLGGVPENTVSRAGRLRAQACFTHAILAGTFGASLVPLCVATWVRGGSKGLALMGLAAATAITIASASSGPVMSYFAALVAMSFWCLRDHMRLVRWGVACTLFGLHMVMKAPVWALVHRVTVVAGSTGYHRFLLLDNFIRRFGEWWICGSRDAGHWGYGLQDITNQFVLVGLQGGLATLILFILLIAVSFRAVGRAVKALRGQPRMAFFCWMLGATLFVHVVSFMGVSYFDQIVMVWYLVLCMVAVVEIDVVRRRRLSSTSAKEPV